MSPSLHSARRGRAEKDRSARLHRTGERVGARKPRAASATLSARRMCGGGGMALKRRAAPGLRAGGHVRAAMRAGCPPGSDCELQGLGCACRVGVGPGGCAVRSLIVARPRPDLGPLRTKPRDGMSGALLAPLTRWHHTPRSGGHRERARAARDIETPTSPLPRVALRRTWQHAMCSWSKIWTLAPRSSTSAQHPLEVEIHGCFETPRNRRCAYRGSDREAASHELHL